MNDNILKQWRKERDAVIRTHDVQKFRSFYMKWYKKGLYRIPLPKDDLVVRVSMEKCILALNDSTEQEKNESKLWLTGHGFKPEF